MKSAELRIGNLVTANSPAMVVTSINKYNVSLYMPDSESDSFDYDVEDLNPVKLTQEILKGAGFLSEDGRVFTMETEKFITYELIWNNISRDVHAVGITVEDENGKREGVQNFVWNMKYLHQLQNLFFSLTGQELQITL